jgi:hypothetical protein
MKNLYLSLFEKTYSDVSLLAIIFMLQMNFDINSRLFVFDYYSEFLLHKQIDKKYLIMSKNIEYVYGVYKNIIYLAYLIKVSKNNPNILNSAFILHFLELDNRLYNIEKEFLLYFSDPKNSMQEKLSVIPNKFSNLNLYKNNIKILSHFLLFEEEAIV